MATKREREEFAAILKAQAPRLAAEEAAVAQIGDAIGYGRLMQAAETVWRRRAAEQGIQGSEHTVGPCAASMVPCGCRARGAQKRHPQWFTLGHCDWCCGSGRVTRRVALAMVEEA